MLEAILNLSNGARFYRADLHNHTPADPQFHCGDFNLNNATERRALAREYVRFAREEQNLDIIGITDHNDISWLREIQEAAEALYPDSLVILPGVELGANDGKRQVHFLALFDPHTDPDQIDHFISSLGLLPHTRFHDGPQPTPRLAPLNTRQLTQKIVSSDDGLPGLAIAAHATRKNGLLHEMEGEGRVLAYEDHHLIAIEIPNSRRDLSDFVQRLVKGEANHYGYKAVACLNSSDGRGLGQTNEKGRNVVGARATRIKLSTFSIEALRHALIDHDSRIRLEAEHTEVAYPRLLGLAIERGFLTGATAEEPLLARFNPNLNAVIGGRGTGKSSLLAALRFVFDLPARTQATAAQHAQAISVTLPAGAQVTAFYELADGKRYKVARASGGEAQLYDVETGQQLAVPPHQLLGDGLPLEVYGQKEIYEIANDPQFQLNLLDGYIAQPLRDIAQREAALLRALDQNAQQISHLEAELEEAEQQLTELAAVQLALDQLESTVDTAQLARQKQLEQEKFALQQFERSVEARWHWLEAWRQKRPSAPLVALNTPLLNQLGALIAHMDTHLDETIDALQSYVAQLWENSAAERLAWQQQYEAHVPAQDDPQGILERYAALQAKREALTHLQRRAAQQQQRLAQLRRDRTTHLDQLARLRREERFQLREEKAQELTAALQETVRLAVWPLGHRQRFGAHLKELFKGRSISGRVIDLLSAEAELTPRALAEAIRAEPTAPDPTPLAQLGLTPANRKKLQALPEELLYQLELYDIPDLPDIALKVGESYRSLTPPLGVPGLSMGQKCTAILSIILVERHTPLLIDQPEDDLDNAFIFREIVQTLRREKERRQFIIATHNANIPVSGDAELILLMKADERRGWVAHRGSIDDPRLREPVENILEGGREAFRLRQAKYNIGR